MPSNGFFAPHIGRPFTAKYYRFITSEKAYFIMNLGQTNTTKLVGIELLKIATRVAKFEPFTNSDV